VIVNANDVAVTGARPSWFSAVILVPPQTTDAVVRDLFNIRRALAGVGAHLVGGHTEVTPAVNRPIVVGQMLGLTETPAPVRSNGVAPGCVIVQVGPAPIEGAAVLAREAGDGSLTVDTIFLRRIYVLFFISLATRRIEYIACSSNPDGRWVSQQARNLAMAFEGQHPFRFLIHDRDTKFSCAFDEVFRTEGIKVIRTPVQAPNANAFAERCVRTVRTDCLDRILILGRRHLKHVRRVYRGHYNEHRPLRALQLLPPIPRDPTPRTAPADLRRRDLLGGLIHEYEAA
jgi:AIR synthase related protein, N-terminal domain/Integrase core domain